MRTFKTFSTIAALGAALALAAVTRGVDASNVQMPTGTIIAFAGQNCPAGYLAADNTPYLRTQYPALFAVVGLAHGRPDSTHFNVPDLRGRFLRGVDLAVGRDPDRFTRAAVVSGSFTVGNASTNGTSTVTLTSGTTADLAPGMSVSGTNIPAGAVVASVVDSTHFTLSLPGRTSTVATGSGTGITLTFSNSATGDYVGSLETDAFQGHWHNVYANTTGASFGSSTGGQSLNMGNSGYTDPYFGNSDVAREAATDGSHGTPRVTSETRPTNVAVRYCIKS